MRTKWVFTFIMFYTSVINIYPQLIPTWQRLPKAPFVQGGKMEDIYFINGQTGWVVRYSGEIYKTIDGGTTWTKKTLPGQPYLRAVGFVDSLRGWIANLDVVSNDILYETFDGGENWQKVTNLPPNNLAGICGLFVVNDSVVYGCGRWSDHAGILKTTDRGKTWVYYDLSQYAKGLVDMFFFSPDSGFVVGMDTTSRYAVVLHTTDGGVSWENKHTSIHGPEWAWKINFPTRTVGYVSLQAFRNESYFLKTTDGGETWNDLPNSNQEFFAPSGIGFANENIGWQGPHSTTLSPSTLIETKDGGITWTVNPAAKNVNRFRMFGDSLGYACGESIYKYTSEIISSVDTSNIITPTEFVLFQNFPNPFNPHTTIVFAIPDERMVNLFITDLKGALVKRIIREVLTAGDYEIRLDFTDLASGLYLYTLTAGNFSETKKMILLK